MYVDDVIKYISGYVVRKLIRQDICHICSSFLTTKSTDSILITVKNRGNLIFPSEDVIKITRCCEIVIRSNYNVIRTRKNIKTILIMKVFTDVCHAVFNDNVMTEHILQQDVFDNHRIELIKRIITTYQEAR